MDVEEYRRLRTYLRLDDCDHMIKLEFGEFWDSALRGGLSAEVGHKIGEFLSRRMRP